MKIFIKGKISRKYFQERVIEVLYKLKGEEHLEFTLIVIQNGKYCRSVAEELLREERDEFCKKCEEILVSTSFRLNSIEYIIVRADRLFLRKSKSAARGLIAHELMHTIQRDSGIEKKIEDAGSKAVGDFASRLLELGISENDAVEFVVGTMKTAVLCLKDLIDNSELLKQDMYEDLLEYYFQMLDLEKYFEAPQFFSRKPSLEEIKNAINFTMSLLPAWLPFVVCDESRCSLIKQKIREKYQKNLEKTSREIRILEKCYREFHKNKNKFISEFFPSFVDAAIEIVKTKMKN